MKTTIRGIAASAALALTIGVLAACVPPPGGGGSGGVKSGCFETRPAGAGWEPLGNYLQIAPTAGPGYAMTVHTDSACSTPAIQPAWEVYYSSTQAGAETWCKIVVGESSVPQYVGLLLEPEQPRVHRCSGGPG